MQQRTVLWIAVGAIGAALLGLVLSYVVFFNRADVVYEAEQLGIPVKLQPDIRLLRVAVQNVGHHGSQQFRGVVTVWGSIHGYDVQAPNPPCGDATHSKVTKPGGLRSQIVVNCSSLDARGNPIKIVIAYSGFVGEEDLSLADVNGAARHVPSVAAEKSERSGFFGSAVSVTLLLIGLIAVLVILVFAVSGARTISLEFVK